MKRKDPHRSLYRVLLVLALGLSTELFAIVDTRYNLRRCIQLPIIGEIGKKVAFDIYRKVEVYLEESEWCYYRSNAEALDMLQSYRQNLALHLKNPEVLGKIATKTRSGSLILTTMSVAFSGIELSVKVVGDNGKDILFSESKLIKRGEADIIPSLIIDWLSVYGRSIPYDGRVLRVSGKEFTIDLGSTSKLFQGSELTIERPVEKRHHPLLNEIVGWRTEKLGRGRVANTSRFQAQVEAIEYSIQRPFRAGDWVVLEKVQKSDEKLEAITKYPELEGSQFGERGVFALGFKVGLGSDTVTTELTYEGYRIAGPIGGISFAGELWATQNLLLGLDVEKNLGAYIRDSQSGGISSFSFEQNIIRFKTGYRFLPMGLFFGPQVDVYTGYGYYHYHLNLVPLEGFGHHKITGLLLGLKGSLPFQRSLRGFGRVELLPLARYSETVKVFGSDIKSVSGYQVELGLSYRFWSWVMLQGSFELASNAVTFDEGHSFNFQEATLKGGFIFPF